MTFENIKDKFIEKLNSLTKMEYYNNMYPYSNLSTQYSIVKREPKYYSTTDTISTRAYRKIVTNFINTTSHYSTFLLSIPFHVSINSLN